MWVLLPAIESPPRTRGIMISLEERTSQPGMTAVPAFLHALLRQVEPYPAAAQKARRDILAFNRSYDALFGLESVPVRNRNAALLYFTDRVCGPAAGLEDGAALIVGRFRAAMTRHGARPPGPPVAGLREARRNFPAVGTGQQHRRLRQRAGAFVHPVAGRLRLARFHLWAEPREDGLVAVGYTPADVATAAKLPRLAAPFHRKHLHRGHLQREGPPPASRSRGLRDCPQDRACRPGGCDRSSPAR